MSSTPSFALHTLTKTKPSSLSKKRRAPSMEPATKRLSDRGAKQFTSPESEVAVIDIQMSSKHDTMQRLRGIPAYRSYRYEFM